MRSAHKRPLLRYLVGSFLSVLWIPAFAITPVEVQKLLASDASAYDSFGYSVAIDGDTAVIGAIGVDQNDGVSDVGAAYVFTRNGEVWTEQAKLMASSEATSFGYSVALDGDTAVIGAIGEDKNDDVSDVGAAYVFTRVGEVWTEQAKLMASDGAKDAQLGYSVAIDGDSVVAGARFDNTNGRLSGAAYVFTRSGDVWTEQTKLLASDGAAYDRFGHSVAIDGDTIVISASFHDGGGIYDSGAAYVFTLAGGVWTEQIELLASDKERIEYFGWSVALDGDTVVIGKTSGAAYVFTRVSGAWVEQAKLLASGKAGWGFGESVSLDGDTAVIGAPRASDDGGTRYGASYVFRRSGEAWTEQAKLWASDKADLDRFGWSVALDGATAVIGARTDDNISESSGAAYVFVLTPVAVDDGPYVLDEGGELLEDVNILDNDSDPDGDPLTPIVVDSPAHSSFFQVMPDGTFDYTHDGSETTSDSFTYRASDGVNESEIATVSLEITPVNDAPRVQLIGQATISIERGAAYTDPGATAEDPEDGDISDAIVVGGDVVDTNVEGTYLITYNVIDSDGLAADEVIRTVIVTVDEPPVITLIGPATLTLQVADAYEEQGATAQDPEDGDLTNAIVIDNPVDTSTPGTYTVTYSVVDSSGNRAEAERTVIVEAAPPPPPPRTDRGGGGGGGAMAPFEVLASILMLLAICTYRRRSASGRFC